MRIVAALLGLLAAVAAADTVYYDFFLTDTYVNYLRPTIVQPPDVLRAQVADLSEEVARHVQLVNDQFPGPLVEATEGDTIVVQVYNNMKETSATIHWHGIHQIGTPFMDGTYMISQCGISPGENFTYEFVANPAGTRWWHSHMGEQYQMGLSGPLVVYAEDDPYEDLYVGDQVVMICDWMRDIDWYLAGKELEFGALINGQWGNGTDEYPYPLIRQNTGQCQRLRFIHHGAQVNGFEVSIYGHNMTIIAMDGHDVEPYTVARFMIYLAQRVDVIVCGDQEPGSYRINMTAVQDDTIEGSVAAYLWYVGSDRPDVNSTLGPANSSDTSLDTVYDCLKTPFDIIPYLPDHYDDDVDRVPDADFQVTIMLGRLATGHTYGATTYQLPWEYAESPLQQTHGECGLRTGTSEVLVEELGQVIEIVIENYMDMVHPYHLHGYEFWVVRQGYLWDDGEGGAAENQTCELGYSDEGAYPAERADPWWGCKYDQGDNPWADWYPEWHTEHGLVMDSFPVPARTWTVIRVLADNPGFWGFHCHKVRHHGEGMSTIFNVAPSIDIPIPAHHPVCGQCARDAEADLLARAVAAEASLADVSTELDDQQTETWVTGLVSAAVGVIVGVAVASFGKPLFSKRSRHKFGIELKEGNAI